MSSASGATREWMAGCVLVVVKVVGSSWDQKSHKKRMMGWCCGDGG